MNCSVSVPVRFHGLPVHISSYIPNAPWCWYIYLQNWVVYGVNVGIRRVNMPKRPSTCQKGCPRRYAKTRLSPSTCKKDCLRRHAKQDCRRRHAKKIVPVDMQKNNSPSTCQRRLSPSICQQSGRRYAKTMVSADMPKSVANIPGVASVDMPRGFVRQCAKGSCPSACQTTSFNGRIIRQLSP